MNTEASKSAAHRVFITKSRAGHYTVSIRETSGLKKCVFLENLIDNADQARAIAARELAAIATTGSAA